MKNIILAITAVSFLSIGTVWGGDDEVEYYAVLMDGKKIGHMVQTRDVRQGKVTTVQTISMTLGRIGRYFGLAHRCNRAGAPERCD